MLQEQSLIWLWNTASGRETESPVCVYIHKRNFFFLREALGLLLKSLSTDFVRPTQIMEDTLSHLIVTVNYIYKIHSHSEYIQHITFDRVTGYCSLAK